MSGTDKAKHKTEEATGKVKETVGDATGNRSLEGEGKDQQTKAKAKNAGEHLKDAAGDAKDALKKG